jgi:hypothetical protein
VSLPGLPLRGCLVFAQAMRTDLDEMSQDCAVGDGPPPSFAGVNAVEPVQEIIGDLDAGLDRPTHG